MSPPPTPRNLDYSNMPSIVRRRMARGKELQGQQMPAHGQAPQGQPAGVFNQQQIHKDKVDQMMLDPNRNPAVNAPLQAHQGQRRDDAAWAENAKRAVRQANPEGFASEADYNAAVQTYKDDALARQDEITDAGGSEEVYKQNLSPHEQQILAVTEANQPGHVESGYVARPEEWLSQDKSRSLASMRPELMKTGEGRATLHQMETDLKAYSEDLSKMLAQIDDRDITEEELVRLAQELPSYKQSIAVDAAQLTKRNLPQGVLENRKKQKAIDEKAAAVKKVNTDTNIRTVQNLPEGRYPAEKKAELEEILKGGGRLDSDTIDEINFNGGEVLDEVTGKAIPSTRAGKKRLEKEEADADKAAKKSAAQAEDLATAAKLNQANPGVTHYKDAATNKWIQVDADGVKSVYTGVTAEKTPAETKAQADHVEAVDKVSAVKDDRESGPPSPEEGNFLINKTGEHGWFTKDEWEDLSETKGAEDWREATPDRVWHQFEKPIAKKGFDKTFEKSTDEEKAYGRALFNAKMDTKAGGVKAIAAYKALKQKEFEVLEKKYNAFLDQDNRGPVGLSLPEMTTVSPSRGDIHGQDDEVVMWKDHAAWQDAREAMETAKEMGDADYQELFRRDRQELYDLAAKAGSAK